MLDGLHHHHLRGKSAVLTYFQNKGVFSGNTVRGEKEMEKKSFLLPTTQLATESAQSVHHWGEENSEATLKQGRATQREGGGMAEESQFSSKG